jgi:hypothetical protein
MCVNIAWKVNLLKPQWVVNKILNEWTIKYLNKDFVNDIVIKLLIVKKIKKIVKLIECTIGVWSS